MREVLAHIEAGGLLPPLVVLQALAANPALKLSVVKVHQFQIVILFLPLLQGGDCSAPVGPALDDLHADGTTMRQSVWQDTHVPVA